MYKVLVADDEGIVLESIKLIIEKHLGANYEVEMVKTGRMAIEKAEEIRPDIIMMDIQMPGINGMDAIEEIKKFASHTKFIVVTAYDQFNYAKRAIDFITKPFNPNKIVEILKKATKAVDEDRQKRDIALKNKEKLETVVPIIESGLIYNMLFQEDYSHSLDSFKTLLELESDKGYILLIEFGDEIEATNLSNPVGASVKAQKFYSILREIAKEQLGGVVGPVMANKIIVLVPCEDEIQAYDERIRSINKAREMIRMLQTRIDAIFRIGIGSIKPMDQLATSYKEAMKAIQENTDLVTHIEDLLPRQNDKSLYDLEEAILRYTRKGDLSAMLTGAYQLLDELIDKYHGAETMIKMRLLEVMVLVKRESASGNLWAKEKDASLEKLFDIQGKQGLKEYLTEELTQVSQNDSYQKEQNCSESVLQAKKYIEAHYDRDLSLDIISRHVNVSPYYLSKIFKDETGQNFIDYLTKIRIEKAQALLRNPQCSIKEICQSIGYRDPNYFSRLFKKQVGQTPTEYREGL